MSSSHGLHKSFLQDETGATSVEYAVMIALILLVAIGAISSLGTKVSSAFVEAESGW